MQMKSETALLAQI